jgi:transcriptional regulator with XRE-family HTH domain
MPLLADTSSIALDVEKVRRLREARGYTLDEAAKRAGLRGGRQHWHAIESGKRANVKLSTLDAIAHALDCAARDLLK